MVIVNRSASLSERPDRLSRLPPASLSLASTHLKPPRPSSLFTSLLKRDLKRSLKVSSPPASDPPRRPTLDSGKETSYPSHPCKTELSADSNAAASESRVETPISHEHASDSDNQILCGRQRLQQHRVQIGGYVCIPDTWGREQQLQEWVSHGIVEDALRPAGLLPARTALMSECQRRRSGASPAMSADVKVS